MSDVRDFKLIDLKDLEVFKGMLTTSIGADATSAIHSLAQDTTAHTIKFYKEKATDVTASTTPAFTVDISDIYKYVGSTADLTTTAKEVVGAINELDAAQGDTSALKINGVATTVVADALKNLDEKVDGATTITVKAADGTATTSVVKAINRLDAEVGTFANLAVETAKGTTASDVIAALNALDTDMGNAYDIEVEKSAGTTAANVVEALNALNAKVGKGTTAYKVLAVETAGTTADTFTKKYSIYQGTTAAADKIVDIDIPKDFFLKDASIKTCTVADQPIQGLKVGDKYFDLEVNVDDGQQTTKHIYLAAKDLIEDFTVEANATEVQLKIDTTSGRELQARLVSQGVDTTAIKDLAVTAGKLATASVTSEKIATGAVTSAALATSAVTSILTAPATTADFTKIAVAAADQGIVDALNLAYSSMQSTSFAIASTAEVANLFA